jgi:hypothetical protein
LGRGEGDKEAEGYEEAGDSGLGLEGWAWAYLSNIRVQNVNNIELFVIFVCLRSVLIIRTTFGQRKGSWIGAREVGLSLLERELGEEWEVLSI